MTIVVCPLHEVDEAVRRWQPSHVIAMASPGAETAGFPTGIERLTLTFHDIPRPQPSLQAVSQADVDRLLAFARAWPRTSPLLIQCWAGVSRSPAAAYAVTCALSVAGQERELAQRLRAVAPFATPNPLVVELCDRALDRGGRMSRAIAEIGRGAETASGATFTLAPIV